jgi:hypothetical protein
MKSLTIMVHLIIGFWKHFLFLCETSCIPDFIHKKLLTMHAAMVELVRKMKAWKQRSKKAKA